MAHLRQDVIDKSSSSSHQDCPLKDQQASIQQPHAVLITRLATDRPQHIEENKTLSRDQDSG